MSQPWRTQAAPAIALSLNKPVLQQSVNLRKEMAQQAINRALDAALESPGPIQKYASKALGALGSLAKQAVRCAVQVSERGNHPTRFIRLRMAL